MLPQPQDFGATAYLSPDKARLEYEGGGLQKQNRRTKKTEENNESFIKRRRQEQRCR